LSDHGFETHLSEWDYRSSVLKSCQIHWLFSFFEKKAESSAGTHCISGTFLRLARDVDDRKVDRMLMEVV
jgi:hypothetical protein